MMMSQTSATPLRAVLRNRRFVALWASMLVSTTGASLVALAASIAVYRQTGSALSVGLLLMTSLLPSLVIGPLAGVLVDRHRRRTIMLVSEGARLGLTLLIPLLLPTGVVWLYVLLALLSSAAQFYNPAHASLLPEVTSDDELAAANALQGLALYGAPFVGVGLAGAMASLLPLTWVFVVGAGLFLVSLLSVVTVREAARQVSDEGTGGGLGELRDGLAFLWRTPSLRALFLLFVPTYGIFGLLNAMHLPFVLSVLRADELAFGLLEGVPLVGLFAASLGMARWAERLPEGRWVALSLGGMSITGALYALSPSVPVALVLGTLYMAANAPSMVGRQLILQRATTPVVRGRVNSAFFVMRDVLMAAGMAAAGLGDLVDLRVLYFVTSALMLPLAVAAFVWLTPAAGQEAHQRLTTEMIAE
jgi:DHA3 family macrolide efflux protein-like MFS transporter